MSAYDEWQRQTLMNGLVGIHNKVLYETNATFKGCVDALAGMLPFMIDGLVQQCQAEHADMERRVMENIQERMRQYKPDPDDHYSRPVFRVDGGWQQ